LGRGRKDEPGRAGDKGEEGWARGRGRKDGPR
jgi:hypothetical protein